MKMLFIYLLLGQVDYTALIAANMPKQPAAQPTLAPADCVQCAPKCTCNPCTCKPAAPKS
jgi:hypothetical protein